MKEKRMIMLKEEELLTQGNDKLVFAYEDKIIKVVKSKIRKYKTRSKELFREFEACQNIKPEEEKYFQKIFSLVDTKYGKGQLCLKEVDERGELAPNLYELLKKNSLNEEKYKELFTFLSVFTSSKIIVNSLHSKNIVYSYREGEGAFRLIDGFGDKGSLALTKFFPFLRYKHKVKCLERLFKEMEALKRKYSKSG